MSEPLCDLCHQAGPDPQVEIDGDLYCASCAEKLQDDLDTERQRELEESGALDDEDQGEDDGDYDFDCGLMPDGQCLKAGSEECDWDCPYAD